MSEFLDQYGDEQVPYRDKTTTFRAVWGMANDQSLNTDAAISVANFFKQKGREEDAKVWDAITAIYDEHWKRYGADDNQDEVKEGHYTIPPINRERYTDLSHEGLEGPFTMKNGKVLYYDPKEGAYYDRDTDMYVSYEDYRMMNEDELDNLMRLSGISEKREVSKPFKISKDDIGKGSLKDSDVGKWALEINGRLSLYNNEEAANNSRQSLVKENREETMNELNKLLELAGINVDSGISEPRSKKNDAGITLELPVVDQNVIDKDGFENDLDLGEKLSKEDPASAWIKDFQKSDDPKFSGDSKEERTKRALGAYYAAQNEAEEPEVSLDDEDVFGDDDIIDFDAPPAKERGAKPEPDFGKKYDDWYWSDKEDAFKEGVDDIEVHDEMEDDGEVENEIIPADDEGEVAARGAKPEPDFAKKYDDWYWSGKLDKNFAETVEEDTDTNKLLDQLKSGEISYEKFLSQLEQINNVKENNLNNGYGDEKYHDKDTMFPNGFDTPITTDKGPSSAKHGDNPLQSKMSVKESIKHSLYKELINFKKSK